MSGEKSVMVSSKSGSNSMAAAFKHDPSKSKMASGGMFGCLVFSTRLFLYVVSVVMGEGLDHGSILGKE